MTDKNLQNNLRKDKISMMSKKLVLVVLVISMMSSCTIYRTINFNADQSGNIENKVDMSGMMSVMNENGGGSNPLGTMGDMDQFNKTKIELESISGITNVKLNYDSTGIITTSYDFNSVDALNKALGSGNFTQNVMLGMGQEASKNPGIIKYKGKKFTWTEVDKKMLKKIQSEDTKKQMAEMDMMLASSKMNTIITFPTAIKKVSVKNAVITNDKTVSYVMSLKEFISKDYKPLVVILK
jgi:hypothetical protein